MITLDKIYQTPEIREFERLAQERFGITSAIMMQRAAKAAFDCLLQRWPQAQHIVVFCGGGNNGGDGYVLALLARQHGMRVTIWQVGHLDNPSAEATSALAACQQANIPIYPFQAKVTMEHPDVVVDAICGIGVHTALREDVVAAIDQMQSARAPVLAIDIPTGINADTGQILGAAVRADVTITFIGLKLGLMTGSGIAYTGELMLNDLQLPAELFAAAHPIAEKIRLDHYASYLKPRTRDWHKGLSGHVLVVGGEAGYTGAPRMAAMAALRVGAGLVTVATRIENAVLMNVNQPEIMCNGISRAEDLEPLLAKADVVVLGPGLGQSTWAKMVFAHVCSKDLPIVLDADGLNLLAQTTMKSDNWVLTPHPGEAARLMECPLHIIQQDRLTATYTINKRYGGICVLKGAGSIVLAPNTLPAICAQGNPGMASAGMGDVLSGVIGGLIAQGVPLGDAAKLGVCMHAIAGDLAAKEGERGMVATDLLPYLRQLSNYSEDIAAR